MIGPYERRTFLQALALSTLTPAFIPRAVAADDEQNMQNELTHRMVRLIGIRFHIAEQGQGPLVLLCHGWPECWYSWRHQLRALADAGFHAVAPDMRGFGQTDAPEDISAYTIVHNVGDMVQLVSTLGGKQAVIIGHDWGAFVGWACAQLRPDVFRAVVAMNPYFPRGPEAPLKALRDAGTTTFYAQYFQTPGVAEAEFERDIDRTMRTMLYGKGVSLMMKPGQGFLGESIVPDQTPSWLTEEDVAYYVDTYKRTGFRGGLNWYRNIDRNWELSAAWEGTKVRQPALFIAGSEDAFIKGFGAEALRQLPNTVPGLKGTHIIPDTGHHVQQERAAEVNAAVVEFLRTV
ncbi:MAG TPA: alpha/beta hydrolase [Stellaceae bacterium]|nr:alpha/beta hydrolase [Stellaceae bacterium]